VTYPHTQRKVHEVLIAARREIKQRGLAKGEFISAYSIGSSPVCVRGALNLALTGEATREGMYWTDLCIQAMGFRDKQEVAEMNDLPDTTLETVLRWFDKAIEATSPHLETPPQPGPPAPQPTPPPSPTPPPTPGPPGPTQPAARDEDRELVLA
jgi:hypothetical protein